MSTENPGVDPGETPEEPRATCTQLLGMDHCGMAGSTGIAWDGSLRGGIRWHLRPEGSHVGPSEQADEA